MDKLRTTKPRPPKKKGFEVILESGKLKIVPQKPTFIKKENEEKRSAEKQREDAFYLKFVKNMIDKNFL